MASRYEKFFYTAFNREINNNQKGLLKEDTKERLTFSDDIIYEIPIIYKYRPDRIAQKFYGDPKLYWVLVYANDISDSPEGFYHGRRIRVPRNERIIEVV